MGIRTAGMHRHRTGGYKGCVRQRDRWVEASSASDMSLAYPGDCSGGLSWAVTITTEEQPKLI